MLVGFADSERVSLVGVAEACGLANDALLDGDGVDCVVDVVSGSVPEFVGSDVTLVEGGPPSGNGVD